MRLFIKIKDGKPFEHPILESNFKQAYPDIDLNNLPHDFMEFVRVEKPSIGPYQVYEGVTYKLNANYVEDVHLVREMTESEKTQKKSQVIADWQSGNSFKSWIFDETLCGYVPPIPMPEPIDGFIWVWNESKGDWQSIKGMEI